MQIGTEGKDGLVTQLICDDYRQEGMEFLRGTDWTSETSI
jgi:hypothetical protein